MADPQSVVQSVRDTVNSTGLKFPLDNTIINNWTCLTFYEYVRNVPTAQAVPALNAQIYLPIPFTGFDDNTNVNYAPVDLKGVGGLIGPGSIAQKAVSGFGELTRRGVTTLAGLAGDAVGSSAGKSAAEQSLGAIANPNPSLSFTGVDLREHVFSWRLIAKSADESTAISNIIQTLKYNALPKKVDGASFTLSYPKIVQITFAPTEIVKISPYGCFLENIAISYNGDGHPAFYKNTNAPVIVDLTLRFKERTILTAEDYANAYEKSDAGIAAEATNKTAANNTASQQGLVGA